MTGFFAVRGFRMRLPRLSVCVAAGLCVLVAASAAAGDARRAPPVDEAGEVPAFAAWRDALLDAVRRRDTDAVVAAADPDIRLSFGDAGRRETFRQWLDGAPDVPWSGERYWQELEAVLALGGRWEDWGDGVRHFCAPYTFTAPLPEELDVFDAAIVIEPDAPLREGPGEDAAVVASLDHDILRVLDWGFDPEDPYAPHWLHVQTLDGAREGYVHTTQVRSPVDYRACFTETDDGWSWPFFAAGD